MLKDSMRGTAGTLLLEFSIPRMGRRIDAVVIAHVVVVAIEFKIGEATFDRSAIDQTWDYALDLKNFHEASHAASIVPVLVASEARLTPPTALQADSDGVYRPVRVGADGLRSAIDLAIRSVSGTPLEAITWARAPYRPTPTIIEAARALYAHHSVEAIARFDAGAENLRSHIQSH